MPKQERQQAENVEAVFLSNWPVQRGFMSGWIARRAHHACRHKLDPLLNVFVGFALAGSNLEHTLLEPPNGHHQFLTAICVSRLMLNCPIVGLARLKHCVKVISLQEKPAAMTNDCGVKFSCMKFFEALSIYGVQRDAVVGQHPQETIQLVLSRDVSTEGHQKPVSFLAFH